MERYWSQRFFQLRKSKSMVNTMPLSDFNPKHQGIIAWFPVHMTSKSIVVEGFLDLVWSFASCSLKLKSFSCADQRKRSFMECLVFDIMSLVIPLYQTKIYLGPLLLAQMHCSNSGHTRPWLHIPIPQTRLLGTFKVKWYTRSTLSHHPSLTFCALHDAQDSATRGWAKNRGNL